MAAQSLGRVRTICGRQLVVVWSSIIVQVRMVEVQEQKEVPLQRVGFPRPSRVCTYMYAQVLETFGPIS